MTTGKKAIGPYMSVEQNPPTDGRKMYVYQITNTRSGDRLGSLIYYGAWHQYVFVPAHDEIVLSAGCMEDLAQFMRAARTRRGTT